MYFRGSKMFKFVNCHVSCVVKIYITCTINYSSNANFKPSCPN